MFLAVKKLHADATLPTRAHSTDAGADLYSAIAYTIPPRSCAVIPIGISIKLPAETYGRIAPRSSLAANFGIDVFGGVIDEGYRGEISVILFNHSNDDFPVAKGDRIAQLIVEKIAVPEILEVQALTLTERGTRGFGSSNIDTHV